MPRLRKSWGTATSAIASFPQYNLCLTLRFHSRRKRVAACKSVWVLTVSSPGAFTKLGMPDDHHHPACNSAHSIVATLDSIRSQTFQGYEVLIIDDESRDGSLEICQRYTREHPEMRISVASISHSGVAAARNHAVARASGEYVAFLDSADHCMPGKLEQGTDLNQRPTTGNRNRQHICFGQDFYTPNFPSR